MQRELDLEYPILKFAIATVAVFLFSTEAFGAQNTHSRWDDDNDAQDQDPAGAGSYVGLHVSVISAGGHVFYACSTSNGPGDKGQGTLYLLDSDLDAADIHALDIAATQNDSNNTVTINASGDVDVLTN